MKLEVLSSDVLVVGAGAAGLSAALGLAPLGVHVLTRDRLGSTGASPRAQGGLAVALGPDDSPLRHAADTLAVAGDLADTRRVRLLTRAAPAAVRRLVALGGRFDRDEAGAFALGREAAHSRDRILHARDATGAELVRVLAAALERCPQVQVHEQVLACCLLVEDGRVLGVHARGPEGRDRLHLAGAVVLATGGLGALYAHTTNPPEALGSGLAMAARAGARLVDLEFVQFHPTALAVGADPMPLLTEALRGQGALVLDGAGRRFLTDHHPAGELAPRDVVARAIAMHLERGERVFLDARKEPGERWPEAFPTVFALCREHGLDPRRERLPVAPAAHYHMGGVQVDSWGRSSLPGLWACGEVASTGVHGANRLASNSLVEALVFGARVAQDVRRARRPVPRQVPAWHPCEHLGEPSRWQAQALLAEARRTLWSQVGLLRDEAGLRDALTTLQCASAALPPGAFEVGQALLAARLVTHAALLRRESRGSHWRRDCPHTLPSWRRRLYFVGSLPLTPARPARRPPRTARARPRAVRPAGVRVHP